MAAERGGWILDIFAGGGIENASESVRRCPREIDTVRLKALGHLGVNFSAEYYGDTITWDQIASVALKWGTSTAVLYPTLQQGWTYYLDAVAMSFTVTDSNGNQIITKIKTLSEMGIVWDILSSHQFKIYFSAKFINDAFLIAWIKRRNDPGGGSGSDPDPGSGDEIKDDTTLFPALLLAYVDQFFSEKLHWKCNRLVKKIEVMPELENVVEQELTEANSAEILRSNVPVRSATGDYTDMAIYGPEPEFSAANKKRNAIIDLVLGEFLMIACFASLMNMSKPVFEPWMLWGLWKWLCSSEPIEAIDKIFDLSPRW